MEQLESYLLQVKKLTESKNDPLTLQNALIPFIEQQTWARGHQDFEQFLIAERFYYEGNYEKALEHYLETKSIPLYQFFCFRATCHMLHSRGQIKQALIFAEKALKLDPTDPFLNALLSLHTKVDWSKDNISELIPSANQTPTETQKLSTGESVLALDSNFDVQTMEPSMNSGSGIFSSTTPANVASNESLTERLYGFNDQPPPQPSSTEQLKALHELRNLAISEAKNEKIRSSLTQPFDCNFALEERMLDFHKNHSEQIKNYLEFSHQRIKPQDESLYILNGWNLTDTSAPFPLLLTEDSRKSHGGYYIRWAKKGIVINPGPGFIKNFHEHGLCIRDIDFVIVTRNSPEAYEDIKMISELNSQLNKTSSDMQMIHYYLHHKARQELAAFLKPSFKQARHTIHHLEMFLDSPDVEKIELDEGITLHYFLSTSLEEFSNFRSQHSSLRASSSLGIKLQLSKDEETVHLGYISGMGWSPLIAHHLSQCDVLIASFGNTNLKDYSKLGYNDDSLGFHGCYSLLEEVAPKLMLLTEFAGRDGDIRIEVTKKIRHDCYAANAVTANERHTILPADIGMTVNLHSMHIKCSMSQKDVPSSDLRIVTSTPNFGRLNYLSPSFCI